MINFKLIPENFNWLETQYYIVKITMENFEDNYHLISYTKYNFLQEIEWDGMFDIVDSYERLNDGMCLYLGIIDNVPFGHVWFRDYEDGRYLFNLFVRNKINTKIYTGKEFTSDIIHRFESNAPIYCEVDDWNIKSLNLFKRLGFQEI